MPIIGIDLGTTNSLIACYKESKVDIIPNRFGEHLTPSIISIDEEGKVFVGKVARERQITHPEYTAAIFKRSMGTRKEYKLGTKTFLSEELSSLIIQSLKEDAEIFLGEKVEEAVIGVPAYFDDMQRKATRKAAELAGLKVERLITEPTAAAIAYGLHEDRGSTRFLIFDLGGGTFDVSILERYKNIMEVRGVGGDNYLGGEDFTDILMKIFLNKKYLELEHLTTMTQGMLRKQAEKAKRAFSKEKVVTMRCKIGEKILEEMITLEEYEKACEVVLAKLRRPIERVLKDASIRVNNIDAIVLVGGATKLPIIRSFVGRLFGRLPVVHIDPNEVVVVGVTMQAAMKARAKEVKEIVLTDVCPYTLGTNVSIEKPGEYFESGHFCPIIERNTVIPVSRVERLYTVSDKQKKIIVEILQGESRLCKENIYLGEISVAVPIAPAGKEAIDIRYTYDINGLLEVEVQVVSNGLRKKLVLEKNPGLMSEEEIAEQLKALSYIKIHPRDKEENRLLLAKGARLYEESIGNMRIRIDRAMQHFENVLNSQDNVLIREEANRMKAFIREIEAGEVF